MKILKLKDKRGNIRKFKPFLGRCKLSGKFVSAASEIKMGSDMCISTGVQCDHIIPAFSKEQGKII